MTAAEEDLLSVASLHALVYCERLFYLEEVERIRVADAAVFAGRRLHQVVFQQPVVDEDEDGLTQRHYLESEQLGLRGAFDYVRRRDGTLRVYELKRGRSAGTPKRREAWDTDVIQVSAYAMLLEEALGSTAVEGRVRYAADGVTVRVPLDAQTRGAVDAVVARARALQRTVMRPPVTTHERKCHKCSLARVCLPEEARLSADPKFRLIRLLPPHPRGQTLHVVEPGAAVGRAGEQLTVRGKDGTRTSVAIAQVGSLVLHSFSQVSTQALRLCAGRDVPVHWVTGQGGLVGSLAPTAVSAQRHVRQFEALREPATCLQLAKRLVAARLGSQLRYLLRASRGEKRDAMTGALQAIRVAVRQADRAETFDVLRGQEGAGAAAYFAGLPQLCGDAVPGALRPAKRTRRPARDAFSVLLNYGYGMLYREVLAAIIAVGLHPGFGFYHRLRSAAQTLALDLMEPFRVPLVDMPVIASLNRGAFQLQRDFVVDGTGVSLTQAGRSRAIEMFERRRADVWRHNVVGYSLSYARIIELEVRLLEKEWSGEPGLFARLRIR